MRMPCDQRIACPCPGLPLSNYSSEDPDRLVQLGRWFGRQVPPPMNIITNDDCVTFAGSTQSSEDADNCAQAANNECEVGQATDSPCDICQSPASGSPGLTLNLGFGFVSTDQSSSSDPCCDPDLPAECCCSTAPQDPDPDPPPPGGPDNPGQPGQPPVNPPRMFGNTPQTCSVRCPDGTEWSATVPSGRIQAVSQALADAIAHSMACEEANQRKECHDGSNTCGCQTFCLDSPADYQVGEAPAEGEEKSFEIVDGDLPNGLSISDTGQITGTPTDAIDNTNVSVRITDSQGHQVTAIVCISVLGITTETLADGEVDVPYTAQLTAAGGHQPYTFTCEADLPTGLTLNPTTGQITGTPDTGGTYNPLFVVTDSCDQSCKVSLQIDIAGTSATVTRIYCPNNPAIFIDVNVTVWGSTTADQEDLNQEARVLAQQQNAQRLQDLGCGCVITGQQTQPGNAYAGNGLITNLSSNCSMPCWVYINPLCRNPLDLFGPANSINLNVQGNASLDWHYINHCVFSNDCANPFNCWIVPKAAPVGDYSYVVVHYHHLGHVFPFNPPPYSPVIDCLQPPHGGY